MLVIGLKIAAYEQPPDLAAGQTMDQVWVKSAGSTMADERTRISGRAPQWLYKLRQTRKARRVRIFGIRLLAHHADVPPSVCEMILRSQYRWQARLMLKDMIKSTDRILEIGAGLGFLTMLGIRIVGASNVRAYEPCQVTFGVARANLRLNRISVEMIQPKMDEYAFAVFRPSVLVIDLNNSDWTILSNADLDTVATIIFEVDPERITPGDRNELRKCLAGKGFRYNRNYECVHAWTRIEKRQDH